MITEVLKGFTIFSPPTVPLSAKLVAVTSSSCVNILRHNYVLHWITRKALSYPSSAA